MEPGIKPKTGFGEVLVLSPVAYWKNKITFLNVTAGSAGHKVSKGTMLSTG